MESITSQFGLFKSSEPKRFFRQALYYKADTNPANVLQGSLLKCFDRHLHSAFCNKNASLNAFLDDGEGSFSFLKQASQYLSLVFTLVNGLGFEMRTELNGKDVRITRKNFMQEEDHDGILKTAITVQPILHDLLKQERSDETAEEYFEEADQKVAHVDEPRLLIGKVDGEKTKQIAEMLARKQEWIEYAETLADFAAIYGIDGDE